MTDCSARSLDLGERLAGTAPFERGFLVLEEPGPWGRDALRDGPLEPGAAAAIERAAALAGLKVILVRRSQARYTPAPHHAWLACVTPRERFLEALTLGAPEEILGLDLSGVADGRPTGTGTLEDEPLHLVCTHGRRDACCARLGRPLWRALGAAAPGRVWQCSHLGGHRFAATMAVLPLGVWLGRVPVARALSIAQDARAGRADPDLLRGRAGCTPAHQVADIAVRHEHGIAEVDAVELVGIDGHRVTLRAASATHTMDVRREPTGEDRPVSCGADAKVEDPGRWVVSPRESVD